MHHRSPGPGEQDPARPQRRVADRLRVARNRAPAAAVAGPDPGDGLGSSRLGSGAAEAAPSLPAGAGGQPRRRAQRPAVRFVHRRRHGRRYRRRARFGRHPPGACAGSKPGRHGGPGAGHQPSGASRRSRPGVHRSGLAVRLSHASRLGTGGRLDRPHDSRGGAAPSHGKRPVAGHRPGPSRTRDAPARTAGHPVRHRRAAGPGGRGSTVRRRAEESPHRCPHPGTARRGGHRRRPAQRQAARRAHPGSPAGDLPRAGPSALLGGSGRLRRGGDVLPAGRPGASLRRGVIRGPWPPRSGRRRRRWPGRPGPP